MTSTNMFQGLDNDGKPSSRVLRPPGGGSSNLFGQCDDVSPGRQPHKMSSAIFAPPEGPQESPKRSNPPGGKSSGIFGGAPAEALAAPPKPAPPAAAGSSIFGGADSDRPAARSHPNKPKDNIGVHCTPRPEGAEQKAEVSSTAGHPEQGTDSLSQGPSMEGHEPRLGPRPRSHNKVIQPPGGKSSVVFY